MRTRILTWVLGISVAGILLLVMALVIMLIWRGRATSLPAPSGPYPVGRLLTTWTDASRQETLGGPVGGHRTLAVWIWYPAEEGGDPVPYMPAAWAQAREADRGVASLLFQRLDSIHSHATSARPAAQ